MSAVPVPPQAPAQRPSSVSAASFSRRADLCSKGIVVRSKAVMPTAAEISACDSWTYRLLQQAEVIVTAAGHRRDFMSRDYRPAPTTMLKLGVSHF